MKELLVAYDDVYLDWNLGNGDGSHPTNPIRAKHATERLVGRLGELVEVVSPIANSFDQRSRRALEEAASAQHIQQVLELYQSTNWVGSSKSNALTAFAMFAGTVQLVDAMLEGRNEVGFNPQGAKHHARFDFGAGFCEFNDFAWAAREFQTHGLRPLYLDWDIHAGDGVFEELRGTGIPTLSIHATGLYPNHPMMKTIGRAGRYTVHHPEIPSYNWCIDAYDGDQALLWAMEEAVEIIDEFKPDVILLAAGADGHGGVNNLAIKNQYTYEGFNSAALMVAAAAARYSKGRVLIGGAGGYQPHDHTPEIWTRVVQAIYENR